ncbi:MAG TPA: DUF72 domain-containing protein [Terriglobales bacterium]|nr:DUF72 domain-containing protein [Terriglobales bacterium]
MLYAGTSGWSYPTWKPQFYPAKLAAAKFLQYYGTRLNSVEVNYTFRHFASEKSQLAWCAATPPEFRFSVKAHQTITHIKRLKDAAEDARSFLASLQPLAGAGKLGFVLFQMPPFVKADVALLKDFLSGLPAGRFAFEFRHASWFTDETYAALRGKNAAICVAESEKLETPDVVTADFAYYRLRKGIYSPEERAEFARRVEAHTQAQRDVFIYFKHEDSPDGALYAEELLARFGARPIASNKPPIA